MVESDVQYTVQYSFADIHCALLSFYSWRKYLSVLVIFGIVGILLGVLNPSVRYAILCGLVLIGVSVYAWLWLPRLTRKTLASPSFLSEQQIEINETGFSMHSDAMQSNIQWSQFLNWSENESSFLLYPTPYTFVVIPKRCLAIGQPEIVRELLRVHVAKKVQNRKAVVVVFLIFLIAAFLAGVFIKL